MSVCSNVPDQLNPSEAIGLQSLNSECSTLNSETCYSGLPSWMRGLHMKRTTFTSLVSLAALPFSLIACGGGGGGNNTGTTCTPGAGGQTAKYVVNTVTVPTDKSQYAIDLNGDSRTDNQLGNIIGALSQQGLNVQMG